MPLGQSDTVRAGSPDGLGSRKRSKDFDANGVSSQSVNRPLDSRLFLVPLEIEEEQVASFRATQWERFDPAQIDFRFSEGHQSRPRAHRFVEICSNQTLSDLSPSGWQWRLIVIHGTK